MRSAHESIDERRYHVVHMIFTGPNERKYLQLEMEAIFGDVLCSLLRCPPALQRLGAEIKDLSLRVLHDLKRDLGERLVVMT